MRAAGPIAVLTLLVGCAETPTSSQPRGVGFSTDPSALARSEAAWATRNTPPAPAVPQTASAGAPKPVAAPAIVPAATVTGAQTAPVSQSKPRFSLFGGAAAKPSAAPEPTVVASAEAAEPTPAPKAATSTGGFSLFGAAKRASPDPAPTPVTQAADPEPASDEAEIGSAALAALAATPAPAEADGQAVADPVALAPLPPALQSGDGPSVVAYALSTTHAPGERLYPRQGGGSGRCDAYGTADFAQIAFLNKGGPAADPLGLDPDGDGFACAWSPLALRAALAGQG